MSADPYVRAAPVPADGHPRKLDAGWFVAFTVRARDAAMAGVQARIQCKLNRLQAIDVVAATEQPADVLIGELPLWRVELQVDPPASGVMGL